MFHSQPDLEMRLSIFTAAALLSIFISNTCFAQSDASHSFTVTFERTLEYLLDVPDDYESDSSKKWPLVLFLHGAGERGSDLSKVRTHGPPKLAAAGKKFPFILVSPQCPENRWWDPETLYALIEDIEDQYRVDKDRIYVTGLSMGGYGTWALAMQYPEKFAAIAPVCGGGIPYRTRFITNLPIRTFHGDADTAVPISETQVLVDELKKRGSTVQFTIYPEVGHNCWDQTYDNPKLYEWMLKQKRKIDPPAGQQAGQ